MTPNLLGQTFGRLVVIEKAPSLKGQPRWLCRCVCGQQKAVHASALRKGQTKSCGCLNAENRPHNTRTHGLRKTALYAVWNDMKRRCHSPSHHAFEHYGARGISVCEQWRGSYEAFYLWAHSNGYQEGLSIDRIDNDQGYQPGNCRFVPMIEQSKNRRNVRTFTHAGHTRTIREWAEASGIPYGTLWDRLKAGKSIAAALGETAS